MATVRDLSRLLAIGGGFSLFGEGVKRRRREDRAAEGREGGRVLPIGRGIWGGIFFTNFGVKIVSCDAFWVVFYVIESYNCKAMKGKISA